MAERAEKRSVPNQNFKALVKKENENSHKYAGRSVFGYAKPPKGKQLNLFGED